jgi:hypothetical protein
MYCIVLCSIVLRCVVLSCVVLSGLVVLCRERVVSCFDVSCLVLVLAVFGPHVLSLSFPLPPLPPTPMILPPNKRNASLRVLRRTFPE